MKGFILLVSLWFSAFPFYAQLKETKYKLTDELQEISGLETYNDSILIAVNDGGNEPVIYFIDLQGQILKKTKILNAVNRDWEDLAMDDHRNLYIADAGNNLNQRHDLAILKVNADAAYRSDSLLAERIEFNYADQTDFAPDQKNRRFDCEAIYWHNDSIHLLTKNTSKSSRNKELNGSAEYVIPDQPGMYSVQQQSRIWSGGTNRLKHQVTAADISHQELILLTYGHVFMYEYEKGMWHFQDSKRFKRITQKEAIVKWNDRQFFVAAEKNRLLGGPYLYKITIK